MRLTNPDYQNGEFVDLVAQEWLKLGIGTDVKFSCGTKQNRQTFNCHKFILINFIKKECGSASLDDEDLCVLLPDTDPVDFSQYIEFAYGFKNSFWRNFDSNKTPSLGNRYLPNNGSNAHNNKNGDHNHQRDFSPTKSEDQLLEVKLEADVSDNEENENENYVFNSSPYQTFQNDFIKSDVNVDIAEQVCPMVGCTFSVCSFDELNLHLKAVHNTKNKPIVCEICKKICLRRTVYIKHMRDAHFHHITPDIKKKKVIRCKTCKETFQDKEEKQLHIKTVHPEKYKFKKCMSYLCPLCQENFTTKKDLQRHRMSVHGETRASLENPKPKDVLCPKCGDVFQSKKDLRNHTMKAHGESEVWNGKSEPNGEPEEYVRHKCFKCEKDFSHNKYLWLHIDDKHPEVRNPQTLLCNLCGATFTVRPKLNSHMEKFHMMGNKKYHCKYCDFKTLTSHVLMEHERTHTDERPEVCQWCGKGFKARKTLRNHERLHTGEKPFKCKFCESSFVQRTSLNVHLQSHHKQDMLDSPDGVHFSQITQTPGAKPKIPRPYSKRENFAPPNHHLIPNMVSHLLSREQHMNNINMMARESLMDPRNYKPTWGDSEEANPEPRPREILSDPRPFKPNWADSEESKPEPRPRESAIMDPRPFKPNWAHSEESNPELRPRPRESFIQEPRPFKPNWADSEESNPESRPRESPIQDPRPFKSPWADPLESNPGPRSLSFHQRNPEYVQEESRYTPPRQFSSPSQLHMEQSPNSPQD